MKKNILITALLMLCWVSPAAAQSSPESQPGLLEAGIRVGYRWVWLDGNTRAGEYEYLHSSLAGSVNLEWDPLPHRFVLESFHLNEKDFYSTMDYSYRDVVVVNLLARGLSHNLPHYSFGPDDLSTPSPSFTDRNPRDGYWREFDATSAFVRFKTPDFPLHLYAEARDVEDRGLVQQRFLLTGSDKVSESRAIHWSTMEAKVGANSHLGPVEIDYSHTEKKFEATRDKVLYDANSAGGTYPHNLVPDIKSSSDTVKIHTSHTGRIVAAATVSEGEKKNEDSGARAGYRNAAGDLTVMPWTNLVFYIKYRHYDLDLDNPDTVKNEFKNTYVAVRDSISSQRNVITGTVWYKATDRLALKGEYSFDAVQRDVWHSSSNFWDEASRTTKSTAKLGATYRPINRLFVRADYSHKETENPAYNMDPSVSDAATASATWTPIPKIQALVSYGGVREKRDELDAPLAGGSRENARDQVLGSVTIVMGQRSSLTASYAFFRNKVEDTLTYRIQNGSLLLATEAGVPYDDVSHTVALALTHAYDERITLAAEASRSYSRGHFTNSGAVDNTSGIAGFSDLRVIESLYSAGIEVQHSKNAATELRYQYRQYDDRIDNTQDGIAKILLAAVSLKW